MSLLFGAKADASMVAAGEDSCVVEAEFDTGSTGHLTIRRVECVRQVPQFYKRLPGAGVCTSVLG